MYPASVWYSSLLAKVESELLIDSRDLNSSGKHEGVVVDLSRHDPLMIMFILDLSENFLHEVFESDKT